MIFWLLEQYVPKVILPLRGFIKILWNRACFSRLWKGSRPIQQIHPWDFWMISSRDIFYFFDDKYFHFFYEKTLIINYFIRCREISRYRELMFELTAPSVLRKIFWTFFWKKKLITKKIKDAPRWDHPEIPGMILLKRPRTFSKSRLNMPPGTEGCLLHLRNPGIRAFQKSFNRNFSSRKNARDIFFYL